MRRILILAVLATVGPSCPGGSGGGGGGGAPTVLAPSSVAAAATSSSQITLTWTNNATNQTSFSILRSLDGITFVVAGSTIGTVTTFTDTGLFPLTTYTYEVVAMDGVFPSPVSNSASATTMATIWTNLSPGGTPPATRTGVAGINDLATNQMLVYSGDDGSFPSSNMDTLALNLTGVGSPAWTPKAAGPAVRIDYSFVYNPTSQKGLLFGGTDGTNAQNTTLLLDPATGWTTLTTAGTPPSARFGHSAVFLGNKMYVFGGQDANPPPNNLLNDVHVLDFSLATPTWSQLSPGGSPPPARVYHCAIADPGNTQIVVFGGNDTSGVARNDTWFLSLTGAPTWMPLTLTAVPPSARFGAAAVYNTLSSTFVLFGGDTSAGTSTNDVWMLSLTGSPTWKQVLPAGSLPESRGRCAAIFDASGKRMIIFAGEDISTFPSTLYNNVWALGF